MEGKVNVVGGHIHQFEFESQEIIVKQTRKTEIDQFQIIFDDSEVARGEVLGPHEFEAPGLTETEILARQKDLYA